MTDQHSFVWLGGDAITLRVNTTVDRLEKVLQSLCGPGERTHFLPNGWAHLKLIRGGIPRYNSQPIDLPNWFLYGRFELDGIEPFESGALSIMARELSDTTTQIGIGDVRPEFQGYADWLISELQLMYPESRTDAPDTPLKSAHLPSPEEGTPEGDELLTDREREVAQQLGKGKSYSEIAKELVIAESTVKRHGDNIQKKWGISGGEKVLRESIKYRGYGRV